jgi:hypothetical protein
MADDDTNTRPAVAARKVVDDTEDALRKEIASLKRQVSRLTRQLSEQTEQSSESVGGHEADDHDTTGSAALMSRAQAVSQTIRDNPGTVSASMLLGGVVGLAIGLLLGQSDARRWYDR